MIKHLRTYALISAALLMVGCGAIPQVQPNDPAYAPVTPSEMQPPVVVNGAIYQAYQSVSLFEDRKARRVGDILTITLEERTTATKDSDTEIKKENDTTIAEPTLFQRVTDFGFQTAIDSSIDFQGEADSSQNNSLQGHITVTVVDVMPNGVLSVRGEKWITLNRGDEYIRITGMVRPEDVGTDNMVASYKVADARITYSQAGELAHANTMGWLTRFFNSPLWPL